MVHQLTEVCWCIPQFGVAVFSWPSALLKGVWAVLFFSFSFSLFLFLILQPRFWAAQPGACSLQTQAYGGGVQKDPSRTLLAILHINHC